MVRMPLEPSFVAIGGLVLAVVVAAVVGGRIGRLVGDRFADRSSAPAIARLGDALPAIPEASATAPTRGPSVPVTLIAGERQMDAPGRDANPFPGVVGSGAFAHTPPPIISIPRNPLSPAMRDRLAASAAPAAASPVPTTRATRRRTRRVGIAASGVAAVAMLAAFVATGAGWP